MKKAFWFHLSSFGSRSMNLSIIFFLPVVNRKRKSFNYPAVKLLVWNECLSNTYRNLDHIVPPDNVLAIALPSGPKNIEFEFTAANRANTAMVFIHHLTSLIGSNCYLDGWIRSCSRISLFNNTRWSCGFLLLLWSSTKDLCVFWKNIRIK